MLTPTDFELTMEQSFELTKMKNAVQSTDDLAELREMSIELARQLMVYKNITKELMKRGGI